MNASTRDRFTMEPAGRLPNGWQALQSFPHVAYALDRRLRFRCVNTAWDHFALANGAREDQLSTGIIDRPFLPGLCEPERSHWEAILRDLLGGELPHHYEEIPCDGPGVSRRIVVTATPTRDDRGEIDGVLFINYDVTVSRVREAERARLAAIVDSSDDAIISKHLDGTIASWNAGAERMYGYTATEAIGQPIGMLAPAGRADEIGALLDAVGRGEHVQHFRTVRVRKDGSLVNVSLAITPLRDAAGTIVGAATIARNITNRVRSEAALRERDEELQLAVDTARLGTWRFHLDSGLIEVSGRCREMFGGSADRLATYANWLAMVHPDDRDRVSAAVLTALADDRIYEATYRIVPEAGDERWIVASGRVVHDQDGTAVRMVGIAMDVTENYRAEAALRESETRLRQIADHVDQVFWMSSPDKGTMLYVSPAYERIWGRTPEHLLADPHSWLEAIHPDDRERVTSSALSEQATGAYSQEYRVVRPDGDVRWVHDRAYPVEDEYGLVYRILGVATDITERKRTEAALADANVEVEASLRQAQELTLAAQAAARAKSEFLAMMSHEIRTPLNGVIGMTSLLLDTPMAPEQHEFVDTIRTCGEVLLSTINDVLDFSKIEAGKFTLEMTACDPESIVEEVATLLAGQAAAKRIDLFTLAETAQDGRLTGDDGRIRQILVNLVGNAVKFTERGSAIVQVRAVEETATSALMRFEVTDTGIGIEPADLARLFQPFAQADGSTTRRYGGTGLGLAICKRLTEMMGGEIGVESIPGRGSTFWFTVRLTRETGSPRLVEHQTVLRGRRALLVDANPASRQLLERQVAVWGMTADAVSHSREATRLLEQETGPESRYDVALVSVYGDERERVAGLDALLAQVRVPVLVLTALGQPAPEDGTTRSCASLTRPIRPSLLRATLASALGNVGSPRSEPTPQPEVAREPSAVVRVLLAEDNVVNQKVAVRILERHGYRVDAVADGREAVEAIGRIRYAAVLMDCHMPEMDGYEATEVIRRAEGPDRRTPIIAMTALAMQGDRERCLAAGMDDYIAKPVRPDDLMAVLSRWVPPRFFETAQG